MVARRVKPEAVVARHVEPEEVVVTVGENFVAEPLKVDPAESEEDCRLGLARLEQEQEHGTRCPELKTTHPPSKQWEHVQPVQVKVEEGP